MGDGIIDTELANSHFIIICDNDMLAECMYKVLDWWTVLKWGMGWKLVPVAFYPESISFLREILTI